MPRRSRILLCMPLFIVCASCITDERLMGADEVGLEPAAAYSSDPNVSRDWEEFSDEELFAFVEESGSTVIIGLTMPDRGRGVNNGVVAITQNERRQAEDAVRAAPGVTIIQESSRLPAVKAKVASQRAIEWLRASPFVDYVAPTRMPVPSSAAFLASGCGFGSTWDGSVEYFEGDVLPSNIAAMDILRAWERSNGDNVTIGLIDTGIDPGQPELNGGFTSGESSGRTIIKDWTEPFSGYAMPAWADDCGHGTHMAGAIAAPKNGASIVGVAWKANLVSVRHHDDVWNGGDAWTTGEAIDLAAGEYGAKIIVMAFMSSNDNYYVSDMINYWYNQDRLFVAAAGTSLCSDTWDAVVFPAKMSSVIAVTGMRTDGSIPCENHRGYQLDAAAVSDQATTGAPFMGDAFLAESGNTSNASAVIGGIAALIWSQNPSWSASQVRSRISLVTSLFSGAGLIPANAFGAVGGLYYLVIDGPSLLEIDGDSTVTFTAVTKTPASGLQYSWNTGHTTRSIQVTLSPPPYGNGNYTTAYVSVIVTDPTDGTTMSLGKNVYIRRPIEDCPDCW